MRAQQKGSSSSNSVAEYESSDERNSAGEMKTSHKVFPNTRLDAPALLFHVTLTPSLPHASHTFHEGAHALHLPLTHPETRAHRRLLE